MPTLNRRHFLRASGVAISLPMLEAMLPSAARAGFAKLPEVPRRMFCINTNMGMMPQFFWPEGDGRLYKPSEYLKLIDQYRDDYTLFSGVSHPDVDGGHHAEISYLTAAPHPGAGGFKNTVSLDQYAAERVGVKTRFPYLSLCVGTESNSASWTASGVRIPAESSPEARMNVPGTAAGNWGWRMTTEQLDAGHFDWQAALARRSGRSLE
jgi:hypothetical protein